MFRPRVAALGTAAALLVAAAVPAAASPPDPGVRPWEAGASNMGMCSAFLGAIEGRSEPNARAEVNHLLQEFGFGYENPGELYSLRARQRENAHPVLECLPRD